MTDDAATLAQGATLVVDGEVITERRAARGILAMARPDLSKVSARPWTNSAEEGVYDTIGGGMGIIADGVMHHDAALIVYAVNHIEQAEADRDKAVALLHALLVSTEFSVMGDGTLVTATVNRQSLKPMLDMAEKVRVFLEEYRGR